MRSLRPNFGFHLVFTSFHLEFSLFWVSRLFDLGDLSRTQTELVGFQSWVILDPSGKTFDAMGIFYLNPASHTVLWLYERVTHIATAAVGLADL